MGQCIATDTAVVNPLASAATEMRLFAADAPSGRGPAPNSHLRKRDQVPPRRAVLRRGYPARGEGWCASRGLLGRLRTGLMGRRDKGRQARSRQTAVPAQWHPRHSDTTELLDDTACAVDRGFGAYRCHATIKHSGLRALHERGDGSREALTPSGCHTIVFPHGSIVSIAPTCGRRVRTGEGDAPD